MTARGYPGSFFHLGPQLTSNDTHRFGVYYTFSQEVVCCKQLLTDDWDNWTVFQMSGAARTAMGVPAGSDMHDFSSIGILGDGSLVIAGNMSAAGGSDAWHGVRCADPVNAFNVWVPWTPALGSLNSFAYPTFMQHPDGSVRMHMNAGTTGNRGAGRANAHIWDCPAGSATFGPPQMSHQGLSVPNAKGPGITGDPGSFDSIYNWSPYTACPAFVEDIGGGEYIEHWFWTWRHDGSGLYTDDRPSYMQYRSVTNTWHAADGTAVTLPIDRINDPAVWMKDAGGNRLGGLDNESSSGPLGISGVQTPPMLQNAPFIVVHKGTPYVLMSSHPEYLCYWNGTYWTQIQRGNFNANTQIGGLSLRNRGGLFFYDNAVWYFSGALDITNRTNIVNLGWPDQGLYVLPATGAVKVLLWHPTHVGADASALGITTPSGYETGFNPVQYRKTGRVEFLVVDRNRPRLVGFGGKAGVKV